MIEACLCLPLHPLLLATLHNLLDCSWLLHFCILQPGTQRTLSLSPTNPLPRLLPDTKGLSLHLGRAACGSDEQQRAMSCKAQQCM